MPRPLVQSDVAVSRDVDALMRIMRRIELDPQRSAKEKTDLIDHLKAVVTVLLMSKRAPRKGSTRAA